MSTSPTSSRQANRRWICGGSLPGAAWKPYLDLERSRGVDLRKLICFLPLILLQPLAADSDQYVGSKACAACHTRIYEANQRTPMARTFAHPAAGGPRQPVIVYNKAADRYYQVVQDETGLHQSEYQIDAGGKTVLRID